MPRRPSGPYRLALTAVTVLAIGAFGICTLEDDRGRQESREALLQAQLPFYPLRTCIVSGEPLSPSTLLVEESEGRIFLLATPSAQAEFLRSLRPYHDILEQTLIRSQVEDYPLDRCIVSGNPLGPPRETVQHLQGLQLMRLCCTDCVEAIQDNPEQFVRTLESAYRNHALEELNEAPGFCPVTGAALGPRSIELMWGNQLIRLADEAARRVFLSQPWRYVSDSESR